MRSELHDWQAHCVRNRVGFSLLLHDNTIDRACGVHHHHTRLPCIYEAHGLMPPHALSYYERDNALSR
jgi:hypothetical protein